MQTADLHIQATAAEVRLASEWLARIGSQYGVPEDQIGRLDLCLNEALANILAHGDEAALRHGVQLSMAMAPYAEGLQATVVVTDAGPAFDMAHAPLGARPRTLEEAEPGGLGLLMIRSFSDALDYQRAASRNVLTFSVRWPGSSGA